MVQNNHDVDEHDREIRFILPKWDPQLSFSCAREWVAEKPHLQCGCPDCLAKVGLTLTFNAEDFSNPGLEHGMMRKQIVSQRTATFARELICPGYQHWL